MNRSNPDRWKFPQRSTTVGSGGTQRTSDNMTDRSSRSADRIRSCVDPSSRCRALTGGCTSPRGQFGHSWKTISLRKLTFEEVIISISGNKLGINLQHITRKKLRIVMGRGTCTAIKLLLVFGISEGFHGLWAHCYAFTTGTASFWGSEPGTLLNTPIPSAKFF